MTNAAMPWIYDDYLFNNQARLFMKMNRTVFKDLPLNTQVLNKKLKFPVGVSTISLLKKLSPFSSISCSRKKIKLFEKKKKKATSWKGDEKSVFKRSCV